MSSDESGSWIMPAPLTIPVPIKHYCRGEKNNNVELSPEEFHEEVLEEYCLTICVNGHVLIQILCLPTHLEELVVGYLLTEGIIASYNDIDSLHIDRETGGAEVWLSPNPNSDLPEESGSAERKRARAKGLGHLVTTDSGDTVNRGGVSGSPGCFVQRSLYPVAAAAYDCENVLDNSKYLLENSELFRRTGNVHSVMLCQGKDMVCLREDVGRFSAFDKCVGYMAMQRQILKDTCIYTTGRVPSSLVAKAIRAGIPMVVSRSAPTHKALEMAARYGVTIMGFARGDRMNLYLVE